MPIVLPLHPRTRKRLTETGLMEMLQKAKHLRILDPLGYIETLSLVKNARALLTDCIPDLDPERPSQYD